MADNTQTNPLIIERQYAASPDKVYAAWVNAASLQSWQKPMPGFELEFLNSDIREGGSTLHRMSAPNGFQMHLLTRYRELREGEKLVFTQYNANEQGEITPNPQMPVWPQEIVATVTLTSSEDGGTLMRFEWQPENPSAEEAAMFNTMSQQAGMGWAGAFENLASWLSQA